ncbi:hypothetical protein [Yoonia sp. 2307UL14-13]|uniref:hypothetical protein n=1 Tax=Yoonia sp. 2307UL14-13 TaxID=3126506 RepID=UPI00309D6C4A
MTALDKYVRLESGGLWRAGPDAQRRDVVVSFGDATLVISDPAGRPLSHWSLPALIRENPGERPAIYIPDDEASEALEIAEDTMVAAIEEVRKALAKARPKPGKLRHWVTAASILIVLALAIFWLPGALMRQTLAVVPAPKRIEIGAAILGHLQAKAGPACRTPDGVAAAERLAARLFGGQTPMQIVILPDLDAKAVALPGGINVLDKSVVQTSDDPAVTAGYVLSQRAMGTDHDPLASILRDAGFGTTLRLLTTGELPTDILAAYATRIAPVTPHAENLALTFEAAKVPSAPYVAAANAPDFSVTPDPVTPILNDSDWISLQNICNA